MRIKNGLVFEENGTFVKRDLWIRNGRIAETPKGKDAELSASMNSAADLLSEAVNAEDQVIDAGGLMVVPGFVDVHTHGAMAHDFCDGSVEGLELIAEHHKRHGITAFCPTSMTLGEDRLAKAFASVKDFTWTPNRARIAGINMEGPFIAKEKKGAQNEAYIKAPDVDMFRRLNELSGGVVKLVTLAPETEGAEDFIRELEGEVEVSIGHTMANYETARRAVLAGAHHITHLYNAMPAFLHRNPGVVGAAAENKDVMAELICDGLHVHPSMVRAAYKLFGEDRLILISDSVEAVGMDDGIYELGAQKVFKEGTKVTLEDGTLAGSASNLYDCFLKAVKFGIPLASALKMVTVNPARSIHMEDKVGTFRTGAFADVLLMNNQLEIVKIISE